MRKTYLKKLLVQNPVQGKNGSFSTVLSVYSLYGIRNYDNMVPVAPPITASPISNFSSLSMNQKMLYDSV